MKQAYLFITLLGFLLVGCGNADDGAMAKLKIQSSSVATNTSVTAPPPAPNNGLSFGPCKTMTVYQGNNASYAALYTNTQACASTSNLNIVKLKTTTQFPASEEFCLVPLNSAYAYGESCFTTTGQIDITLNTTQFTAITLVRKADLSAYKAYLMGSSAVYPAMAFAQLR